MDSGWHLCYLLFCFFLYNTSWIYVTFAHRFPNISTARLGKACPVPSNVSQAESLIWLNCLSEFAPKINPNSMRSTPSVNNIPSKCALRLQLKTKIQSVCLEHWPSDCRRLQKSTGITMRQMWNQRWRQWWSNLKVPTKRTRFPCRSTHRPPRLISSPY